MRNKYRIEDNIVYIEVKYKEIVMETLIDLEDFDLVNSNGAWHAQFDSNDIYYICGHRRINNAKKIIKIHRLIMDISDPKIKVDHINHNTLDNRKCNLRLVTDQENQFNKICKGYTWNKREQKWRAYIKTNGKEKHLGYFFNENDAKNAYLKAKEEYHIINPKNKELKNEDYYKTKLREIKGYYWSSQAKKWQVRISINGKYKHIGYYNTEEDARQAYLETKEKYHKN